MIDDDFMFELAIANWESALSQISDDDLWRALREIVMTEKFPPSPGCFLDLCKKYRSERSFYGPGDPTWEFNRKWEEKQRGMNLK